MNKIERTILTVAAMLLTVTLSLIPGTSWAEKTHLEFSGGPGGGTFQYFSNGIATHLTKHVSYLDVTQRASAGSVANLSRVQAGEAAFGIAYSGDLYLARKGELPQDSQKYTEVQAVAFLYGAPAHLLVLDSSSVQSVYQLAGKKVAIGGAGSGAAASAQRYFTALGLWDKIQPQYIGYNLAIPALAQKEIEALWIIAGFPNPSVTQAAAAQKIRLLDTVAAGEKSGFFKEFPFYSTVTIPAGTYSGVDKGVKTFQDSALWVAGKQIPTAIVYDALKDIFSSEGLAYMVKTKSTAKSMGIASGLDGIATPLHSGAEKFWKEQNLAISPFQAAR